MMLITEETNNRGDEELSAEGLSDKNDVTINADRDSVEKPVHSAQAKQKQAALLRKLK